MLWYYWSKFYYSWHACPALKIYRIYTLGVYYLTKLLLPFLLKSSRVINVSSGGMYNVPLDVDDLQFQSKPYDWPLVYSQTKRAEVELASLNKKMGQTVSWSILLLYASWLGRNTGLAFSLPKFNSMIASYLRTSKQGADTIVYAADSPQIILNFKWFNLVWQVGC